MGVSCEFWRLAVEERTIAPDLAGIETIGLEDGELSGLGGWLAGAHCDGCCKQSRETGEW